MVSPAENEFPRHPEALQALEYDLPEGALTGEALLARLRQVLKTKDKTYKTSPAKREEIFADVQDWCAAARPGEPYVELEAAEGRCGIDTGGIVRSPMFGLPGYDRRHMDLCIALEALDYRGRPAVRTVAISTSSLLWSYSVGMAANISIGEQAVSERFAQVGRQIQEQTGAYGDINFVAPFLETYRRTQLPLEYLRLDNDARAELCTRIIDSLLTTEEYYLHQQSMNVIGFVAGIQTANECETLLEAIEDQWASVLPVHADGADTDVIMGLDGMWQYHETHPSLLQSAGGVELGDRVRFTSLVADLYERRAAQEQEYAQPDALLTLPEVTVTELPMPRELFVFTLATPRSSDIAEDIAYIRKLAAAGGSVTQHIERDFERMHKGIGHLSEYAMSSPDPVARMEAFAAMEYLFNLQVPEQRSEFYRLMGERFALSVPMQQGINLRPHIHVADAMARLMPEPPHAPNGDPYTGTARTAAMLGHFYRRRAHQLLARQLRRYQPLGENEESSDRSER